MEEMIAKRDHIRCECSLAPHHIGRAHQLALAMFLSFLFSDHLDLSIPLVSPLISTFPSATFLTRLLLHLLHN